MRLGELIWNDRAGEGDIRFSKSFEKADWVQKADAIVDWIHALQKEYNDLLPKDHRREE